MKRYVILRASSGRRSESAIIDARIEVARLSPKEAAEARMDPSVSEVAPVMPVSLIKHYSAGRASSRAADENDSWGISAVGADLTDFTGAGVTVAVIDSGIANHAAFDDRTIEMRDFSGSGNGDVRGHGTHCAGTIFGRDVAGRRIGIARGVERALIGKVVPDRGSMESHMVFSAMMWAFGERADIVSMSLGFDYPGLVARWIRKGWPEELAVSEGLVSYRASLRMFEAIVNLASSQAALGFSPLIIAAAGNQSRRGLRPDFKIGVSLPAAAAHVISVGAVGRSEGGLRVGHFSNIMPTIAAPGIDILSAWHNGGLKISSGTSTACPHVAGVAALWLEKMRRSDRKPNASRLAATLRVAARKDALSGAYDPSDVGFGIVAAPAPTDEGTR